MKQDVVGKSIMAQSSSVAREPSMEEILASIRRIIEESDTGRPDEIAPQPVNSDDPPRANAPEPQPVAHLSEEAELPPREGIAVPPPAPRSYATASGRPASPLQSKLAERESARPASVAESQKLPTTPAEPQTKPVEDTVTPAGDIPEGFLAPEASPEPTPDAGPPEQEFIAEPVGVASEIDFAEPSEASPTSTAPATERPVENVDEGVSLDLQRALEPILSETAERQVSAAFDDLSFAVRSEQRRSFDEIAQEIMRPLLQDWLDNNLPTLVERLVREEIERVARGGRR
jgi:cell pole-organizing protein PopZ